MENILTTADIIANKTKNGEPFSLHNNLIICGENGSGKTTFMHRIIDELKKDSPYTFYYIDYHNRMIYDPLNTAGKEIKHIQLDSIVDNRTTEANFSVKDVFDEISPGAAVVYNTILTNFDYYKKLFEKYLDIELSLDENNDSPLGLPKIFINGDGELYKLATSESARMRILFEIDYAVAKGAKTIYIDEFDASLSEDTTTDFLMMLLTNYENISFVVSISHALTSLISLTGFDGALICDANTNNVEDNFVRLFDVDSIAEVGQIDKIKRLFSYVTRTNMLEEMVARFVDTNEIRTADVKFMNGLVRDKLTGREKILYDYAKEVMQ